jgi:hypothetical protein
VKRVSRLLSFGRKTHSLCHMRRLVIGLLMGLIVACSAGGANAHELQPAATPKRTAFVPHIGLLVPQPGHISIEAFSVRVRGKHLAMLPKRLKFRFVRSNLSRGVNVLVVGKRVLRRRYLDYNLLIIVHRARTRTLSSQSTAPATSSRVADDTPPVQVNIATIRISEYDYKKISTWKDFLDLPWLLEAFGVHAKVGHIWSYDCHRCHSGIKKIIKNTHAYITYYFQVHGTGLVNADEESPAQLNTFLAQLQKAAPLQDWGQTGPPLSETAQLLLDSNWYDDGHAFGWKAKVTPAQVESTLKLAGVGGESELQAIIQQIESNVEPPSVSPPPPPPPAPPPPPPPVQLYRYSFSGDMKASWQGPLSYGSRDSVTLDVLSGSVCGDPLTKNWAISENLTEGTSSLPLNVTANFAAANPYLTYVYQAKDNSGTVTGEVDLKLLFSPGTYAQMTLQGTKSGDIIGPTISPSSVPVVVTPVSSCP